MQPTLLRAGIDTLQLAFQGALPSEVLARLKVARERAAAERQPALASLGPAAVKALVRDHGMRGGFAFMLDTGPAGAIFAIRDSTDPAGWNVLVKPHAEALLALGYGGAIAHCFDAFAGMGGRLAAHSVSRCDYAMDIRADTFALELARFVAHPRAKRAPHWSERDDLDVRYRPAAILCGRRFETITIGRMPGMQVTVYDKTAQARIMRKPYWFEAWRIDPDDTAAQVMRTEFRAGKRELKDRRGISTLGDLEARLGDFLRDTAREVRYLDVEQTDSNVHRQRLDPLWQTVTEHLANGPRLDGAGELPPGRVQAITLAMMTERYEANIAGNAAGLAATLGLADESVAESLPEVIAEGLARRMADDRQRFPDKVSRARQRVALLTDDGAT